MTILTDTNLETHDYAVPGWVHIYNKNIELLNYRLLKIQELLDVDTTGLKDKSILVWHSGMGKWVCRSFE